MRPGQPLLQRHRLLPVLVLLCSLVATLVAWYSLRHSQLAAADLHLQQLSEEVQQAIEKRMGYHQQILLGAAGLFEASQDVTRDEWRRYVQRLELDANYPGIQGVGYTQAIRPDELAGFEAELRRQGFVNFAVRPAGPRALYTSILYLEPFSGRNLAAFGYDMYAEPVRQAAMSRAARSGRAQLSGRVTLVQETYGQVQAGLLMYLPIYRRGQPLRDPLERLQALQGFVYSPYRVNDLMAGILGGRELQIDFALYAGPEAVQEQLLYVNHPRVEQAGSPHSQARLHLLGQTWTLHFHAQPGYFTGFQQARQGLLVLGSGISLLLFFLARALAMGQQRALTLAHDMTAQLRRSEARLQRVLQGGHDGWWDLDIDNRHFYASARAWQMLGYPEAGPQPALDSWKQLVHPDDLAALQHALQPPAGQPAHYLAHQCRLLRRDGESLPVLLRALVQCSAEGRPQRVSGTAMDLSEQKRIEQLKSDFVSTVSHELRTPLTSIAGSLGLVNGGAFGAVPEPMRPMLEIAQQNSLRLSHLINDLLDMDKLAAGKLSFTIGSLDLHPQLRESLDSNQAYARTHQVELHLDPGLPIQVRADALRLQQVLANLLSNAIKFSPAGGRVCLHATLRNDCARVSVSDQGCGIPEHFRARVFQKFSQADSGDHRQQGGTGLGLAISKELVERMGGRIGFDSVAGQGARFWFELPLAPAAGAPVQAQTAAHVLHVTSDAGLRRQVALQAGRLARCSAAAGLAEARRLLAVAAPDLLLLDPELPDGSGLELVAEVRRLYPGLPVVILSSIELSDEQLSAVEAALTPSHAATHQLLDILAHLRLNEESDHA